MLSRRRAEGGGRGTATAARWPGTLAPRPLNLAPLGPPSLRTADSFPGLRTQDAANEKNVNFSFFSEIQRRCKKLRVGSGIKPGATTVPQVKGLSFVSNPQFQHLM